MMYPKILRLFSIVQCFFFSFSPVIAQVTEHFSDGELTSNPLWIGDSQKFKVQKFDTDYYLLCLEDNQKGSAVIATPSALVRGTEWRFHFQLNGSARQHNSYARVYLAADTPDLHAAVQGYFVDFGSHEGLVSLVRQDGAPADTVILADSRQEMKLVSTSNLEVCVVCTTDGQWSLWVDIGTGDYALWGTATDTTYCSAAYFGIHCEYTKSNSRNFSFGTISVAPLNGGSPEVPGEKPSGGNQETPGGEDGEDEGKEEDGKGEGGGQEEDGKDENGGGDKEPDVPEERSGGEAGFSLENRAFTPNGDGHQDEAVVAYVLPCEGYTVKLKVCDVSGRVVRQLNFPELTVATATIADTLLKWDGKNEDGHLLPLGLYILVLEAEHPSSARVKAKMAVALTR